MDHPADDSAPRGAPTLSETFAQAPPASVAVWAIAFMGAVALLKWASAFFVPVAASVMMFYPLDPFVETMVKRGAPRAAAAAAVILFLLGGLGWGVYAASEDVDQLIDALPEVAAKLREAGRPKSGPEGATAMDAVRKAATQLERAAETAAAPEPERAAAKIAQKGVQRVVVEKPKFDLRDYLWNGALSLAGAAGQLTAVSFLTFFMLAGGDAFRRKLAQVAGPDLGPKRAAIGALDEIGRQMRRYMLIQVATSSGVGIAMGVAFWAVGMKHAVAWGIAAGLLNFVPYVGFFAITGASAAVAFMQFGAPGPALVVAASSMAIHMVEGNLVTPMLVSKGSRMSATAMFAGVLAWAWLWGAWGLLLGMPLMMSIKAVCDKVERLKPVGNLLGK